MRQIVLILAVLIAPVIASALAAAEEVSIQQRDAVEERLSANLVLPQTALWRFAPIRPYVGSETLICGEVNYQSLMRKYVGYHRFYATLDGLRVTLAQIDSPGDDPSGRRLAKIDVLCGKP